MCVCVCARVYVCSKDGHRKDVWVEYRLSVCPPEDSPSWVTQVPDAPSYPQPTISVWCPPGLVSQLPLAGDQYCFLQGQGVSLLAQTFNGLKY